MLAMTKMRFVIHNTILYCTTSYSLVFTCESFDKRVVTVADVCSIRNPVKVSVPAAVAGLTRTGARPTSLRPAPDLLEMKPRARAWHIRFPQQQTPRPTPLLAYQDHMTPVHRRDLSCFSIAHLPAMKRARKPLPCRLRLKLATSLPYKLSLGQHAAGADPYSGTRRSDTALAKQIQIV